MPATEIISSGRAWTVPPNLPVSFISPFDPSKKNIMIFATGGTIASRGKASIDSSVYTDADIGVASMVHAVPEILGLANIYGVQVSNVESPSITSSILLDLARWGNRILEDEHFAGLVITHGTDTLEETAFFLDLTIDSPKPFILTAAFRPSTALSADGPANLYQSIAAAVHPGSKGRGGLVVMNDRIGSKTHVNFPDGFKAPEQGFLGGFHNNRPFYYNTLSKPLFKNHFEVSRVTSLPQVDIVYGHQEFDFEIIKEIVRRGAAKGIILATPIATVHDPALEEIAAAFPIIRNHRVNQAVIAYFDFPANVIQAGLLNSQKARIQLQLALTTGRDVRDVFEGTLRDVFGGR